MTDPLKVLWPLVDATDSVFGFDLLQTCPAGVHERLLEMALLRQTGSARQIRCPDCYEHTEEVIIVDGPKGKPRFFIYCPETLRVEISPENLRQWRVDVDRLVQLLAKALSANRSPQALIINTAWCLGQLPVAGIQYNVVFLRMAWGEELKAVIARMVRLTPPAKTILLVALANRVGEIDHEDFAGVVPLAGYCRLENDTICLDADHLQAALRIDPRMAAFVFRREGQMWTLTFEGECVHMRDSVGLAYIARLLSEPHRDIPAVSLLAARIGIDPRVASSSSGEILDEEARKDYQRRYTELQEDLDEANENNDLARIERLQMEMDQLATELAGAVGLGGRTREQSDAEKVRKSVSMAVSREIKRIDSEHHSLACHLVQTLSSGRSFRYSPPNPTDWLT